MNWAPTAVGEGSPRRTPGPVWACLGVVCACARATSFMARFQTGKPDKSCKLQWISRRLQGDICGGLRPIHARRPRWGLL